MTNSNYGLLANAHCTDEKVDKFGALEYDFEEHEIFKNYKDVISYLDGCS